MEDVQLKKIPAALDRSIVRARARRGGRAAAR
eukprot:COSAG01_NODE_62402_length_284_cov_5.070270_1_plen_31_part_10